MALNHTQSIVKNHEGVYNMTPQTGTTLKHLFEARFDYREGQEPSTSAEGKVGEYIGSGDGTVTGTINGTIKWDLYEAIDDGVCLTNFAGTIETEDGAIIHYDARGHGKVINLDKPNQWVMVYGVKFSTEDQRYDWLNATLGVWEGEFDMETYKHHYQVYAHVNSE
ncbi:MAG: DUF3237 family protein [Chloroflexi bacterium]|nr:MAG: DUF3237 family protein [Chloroflexota bacterium]